MNTIVIIVLKLKVTEHVFILWRVSEKACRSSKMCKKNFLMLKLDLYQQTDSLRIQKWMDFENTKPVGMHTLYST